MTSSSPRDARPSVAQRRRAGKPPAARRRGPSPQKLAAERRKRRARIGPILERLAERYGQPAWAGPRLDPVSELVLTILSQNTSDVNSHRAFLALRERYPTWEAILDAPATELAAAIRSGGLPNIKAPRIQRVLAELRDAWGGWDLSFLRDLPPREARDWLSRLPGIGPKTASIVLLFALGRPSLPVDTHVYRVARRIGLIPQRTDVVRAHDLLEEALEPDAVYPFHVLLIRHGREVCRAPRPICGLCPVTELCDYYADVRRGRAAVAPTPRRPPGEREPRYHDELIHGWAPPER